MSAQRVEAARLVRLFEGGSLVGLTDGQLLERFVRARDEPAFEALVARHGPMVMGTCRRMLRGPHDVEDAFQATFLVLIRRAASLGPADAIGPWLHGVAVRVAQQARGSAARRERTERTGLVADVPTPDPVGPDAELGRILDQEINRLPAHYRLPIVLCYLEGQTHEQAARTLEWPLGTVKGRLARARALLEGRLARRGVACAAMLTALANGTSARAALPHALIQATCRLAGPAGGGPLITSVASTSVARLVQGVLSAMMIQKLKLFAGAAAIAAALLSGAAVLARQQGKEPVAAEDAVAIRTDREPARSGPIADIKSLVARNEATPSPADPRALYQQAIRDAKRAFVATDQEYRSGKSQVDRVYLASRLLMEAEREGSDAPADRLKAIEGHRERMHRLARQNEELGSVDDVHAANARAYLAEAELLLAQAGTPRPKAPSPPAGRNSSDPDADPRTRLILDRLEQPVAMNFPNETPLEDVLKYIQQAAAGPDGKGFPVYVDPMGLQEADRTLTSPIQLNLEGVPLRRSLQLLLSQLGLIYFVDDGILVVTSRESEHDRLPPSSTKPSPFAARRERAERGEMTVEEMKSFIEELKIRKEMMKSLEDLQSRADAGGIGPQSPMEPLVKELRVLVEEIKVERKRVTNPQGTSGK